MRWTRGMLFSMDGMASVLSNLSSCDSFTGLVQGGCDKVYGISCECPPVERSSNPIKIWLVSCITSMPGLHQWAHLAWQVSKHALSTTERNQGRHFSSSLHSTLCHFHIQAQSQPDFSMSHNQSMWCLQSSSLYILSHS